MAFGEFFSCGIQGVVPSGQYSSILPSRVANHSAVLGSSCPLIEVECSQIIKAALIAGVLSCCQFPSFCPRPAFYQSACPRTKGPSFVPRPRRLTEAAKRAMAMRMGSYSRHSSFLPVPLLPAAACLPFPLLTTAEYSRRQPER